MTLSKDGAEWITLKARHRTPEPLKRDLAFIQMRGPKAAVPVDDRGKPVRNDV
jgi:hypothetical protein